MPPDTDRTQRRPRHRPESCIIDWFPIGFSDTAVVSCCHGYQWPEGDRYRSQGGAACEECGEGFCEQGQRFQQPVAMSGIAGLLEHIRRSNRYALSGDSYLGQINLADMTNT